MTPLRIASLIVVCLVAAPLAFGQSTYSTGFEPPAFVLGDVNGIRVFAEPLREHRCGDAVVFND